MSVALVRAIWPRGGKELIEEYLALSGFAPNHRYRASLGWSGAAVAGFKILRVQSDGRYGFQG